MTERKFGFKDLRKDSIDERRRRTLVLRIVSSASIQKHVLGLSVVTSRMRLVCITISCVYINFPGHLFGGKLAVI